MLHPSDVGRRRFLCTGERVHGGHFVLSFDCSDVQGVVKLINILLKITILPISSTSY